MTEPLPPVDVEVIELGLGVTPERVRVGPQGPAGGPGGPGGGTDLGPLTARVATEEAARAAADDDLSLTAAGLDGRLGAEEAARVAADLALDGRVDLEAATRVAADLALGVRVDGEIAARLLLAGDVDALELAVATVTAAATNAQAAADAAAVVAGAAIPLATLGQPGGPALLDAQGRIATSALPPAGITSRVPVADAAARLALSAADVQPGDLAVQADTGSLWLLVAPDPSLAASWREQLARADVVTGVNGQRGDVVLGAAQVGADPAGTSALEQTRALAAEGALDDRVDAEAAARSAGDLARPTLAEADARYVGAEDGRLTNARTPTAHALSHQRGGSDPLVLEQGSSFAVEAFSRLMAAGGATVGGSTLIWSFFTPDRDVLISSLIAVSSGTAAIATTLARLGLWTADNEDATLCTLVAETASDPTLFAATNTAYTRALSAARGGPLTFLLQRGVRYGFSSLGVGWTTPPVLRAAAAGVALIPMSPPLARSRSGQNEHPAIGAQLAPTTTPAAAIWMGAVPAP